LECAELENIAIAIDGPAGAGKSTIAKIISRSLGIIYLDTGAMYRTVALKAINEGIDTRDAEKLAQIVGSIDIRIEYRGSEQLIFLDSEDVSKKIRTPEVSIGASNVAVVPAVRVRMVELQREIARNNSVVMDGRDIGTYVLPNARYKFFLTASVEERARRRFAEQQDKGMKDITFEEVLNDIVYRDKNDSTRDFAPLSKAEDAVLLDTTSMSVEEVAHKILSVIKTDL
jgi:cytidylate kinase